MSYTILDFSKPYSQNLGKQYDLLKMAPRASAVVLLIESSKELAMSIIACFELGLVVVPLDPRLSIEHKTAIISKVRPSRVILEKYQIQIFNDFRIYDEKISFIIFSSGSMGAPKGIVHKRSSVIGNALKTSELHGIQSSKRLHGTCMPLIHCNAIMMSLMGTYLAKQKLVLFEKPDPLEILKAIDKYNIRTFSISPAILSEVLSISYASSLQNLEYFISASSPLSQNLCSELYKLYGPKLRQGYGLSELVNFSFMMPLLDDKNFIEQYINNPPPVGYILENSTFKLVDNEILIKSEDCFLYYLDDIEETKKVFDQDGYVRTGDFGELRDGYLVINGRKKEIINRGGETIYPIYVDELIKNSTNIASVAAFGVINQKMDNVIGAYIEISKGVSAARIYNIINKIRPPIDVVSFDNVLKTLTLKPKRSLMAEQVASLSCSQSKYIELCKHAYICYKTILTYAKPSSKQLLFIFENAKLFVEQFESRFDYVNVQLLKISEAIHLALNLLSVSWPKLLASEIQCSDVIRQKKGLWERLMCEYPMGIYADAMSMQLIQSNALKGRCIELGCGVGNTTRKIISHLNEDFVRTDINIDIAKKLSCPGKLENYNFNCPSKLVNFDTVFSTNAIHCAVDKPSTLKYIYDILNDGGKLILSEGNKFSELGFQWCLNAFFGLLDGWWNVGGFLTRDEWLESLESVGFDVIRYSKINAGRFDLGGLIIAEKIKK
ncbi:AMP-binding protein [Xenorhabdus thuongxuanensis]|uniref:Fatty-acid--CoA ligase n=1 Tax=Xenorhabdus thuongxuanensis TaxID=1873484 RepID=A0A1Q5U177_9GAMM|nr:AMP-binding protein [Xenorhabdus thuongxuanensis]OKP06228.1 fatty-acid--CoA ligase [Xenorhabdus thuongxuanensis]